LDVTVWYPAQAGGEQVLLGDNRFFIGTHARSDAPIVEGRHPLIVLSHGAGGHAPAMGWIAAPLAQQGFIVAAPNHPGSTSEDESAADTFKFWLRPADLTATLNTLEKEAFLEKHLDMDRVGALGFSAGGYTALAVAGVLMNPQLLAAYCDTTQRNPYMCRWAKRSGVDLHTMDLQPAGRDNSDKRIRSVVAIDPGLTDIMTPRSVANVSIPVDLINLGRSDEIMPTLQASEIAKTIKDARYTTVDDAVHESFLAECKTDAIEGLKREKLPPLCDDGGGRSRSEIHAQLIDMIVQAFNRTLKPSDGASQ
ncbi:MAG TPA: alpha/beta fold hydrolase, partial [Phyllobacterium sp.]|nr:alpha/beta fold hydrolase [Phyllobacterium sp.]